MVAANNGQAQVKIVGKDVVMVERVVLENGQQILNVEGNNTDPHVAIQMLTQAAGQISGQCLAEWQKILERAKAQGVDLTKDSSIVVPENGAAMGAAFKKRAGG